MDDTLTMRPYPWARIGGIAARVNRNDAARSHSMTSSQAASVSFHTTPSRLTPALFTRMSSRPKRSRTAATARAGASRSVPSALIASAQRPVASIAATAFAAASLSPRNVNATCAPCVARATQIARPIPRDPPVTSATTPARSSAIIRSMRSARERSRFLGRDRGSERRPALAAERECLGEPLRAAGRAGLGVRAPERLARSAGPRSLAYADPVRAPFLGERGHALVRLERVEVEREPIPGVPDGHAPGEVLPEVRLLFGVAHAFGERVGELRRELRDGRVELGRGDDLVHESPVEGGLRVDPLAGHEHLAGAPVADHEREPLRRAAGGDAAHLHADLAEPRMVRRDGEVTGAVELISPADRHPVDPGDGRLAHVLQRLDRAREVPHVLPVVARPLGVVARVLLHVAARAERLVPRAGEDDDRHAVVARGVLERLLQLAEGPRRIRVVGVGPRDRDRRDPAGLLVVDFLERQIVPR